MSVDVPAKEVTAALDKAFAGAGAAKARFYKQLQLTRRVQPRFHVTLMHRVMAKEHPALWARYTAAAEATPGGDGPAGACDVQLERVVCDDRVMAIVVRLVDPDDQSANRWECANKVAHITVGTRDDAVKPKESNVLLDKWLADGASDSNGLVDVALDGRPTLKGTVRGVLSR